MLESAHLLEQSELFVAGQPKQRYSTLLSVVVLPAVKLVGSVVPAGDSTAPSKILPKSPPVQIFYSPVSLTFDFEQNKPYAITFLYKSAFEILIAEWAAILYLIGLRPEA